MSRPEQDPSRWRDRPPAREPPGAGEEMAGWLMRAAERPVMLGDTELARIRARVLRAGRGAPVAPRLAVMVAAALVLSATLIALTTRAQPGWWRRAIGRAPTATGPAPVRHALARPLPLKKDVPDDDVWEGNSAAPPPPPSASPLPASGPERGARSRHALAPAAGPGGRAARDEDTERLANALRELRVRRAPARALAILDGAAGGLARGELAREATLVRVEALLALDRRAEALAILTSLPLSDGPGTLSLLLERGELRVDAGRCDEALRDFETILQTAPIESVDNGSALYGRALCRSRAGDTAGARSDLERYRRLFPDGVHAREVDEWLRR